jgi:hypothetical protein
VFSAPVCEDICGQFSGSAGQARLGLGSHAVQLAGAPTADFSPRDPPPLAAFRAFAVYLYVADSVMSHRQEEEVIAVKPAPADG